MTDGDLETYGTAYFSAAERPDIEFKFKSSTLIKTVDVYGDYGELQYLRVRVDSWYCGRCGSASVCYIDCNKDVFGKNLLLRKFKENSDFTGTYLRIYEIKINGEMVSQKIDHEEKNPDEDKHSGGISAGKIGGIVVGTLCGIILLIVLLVRLIKVRRKRKEEKNNRFYLKLIEEYVRESEGGALSGQFLIPRAIVYSKRMIECSINVHRGPTVEHDLVKFRIDRTGERQTGRVTVRFIVEDRDELITPTLGAGDIGTTVEEPTGECGEEIEPTVNEQLLPPTAPKEPPPLYQNSNIDNLHNEVPSYEEVMANSEYFPGAEL